MNGETYTTAAINGRVHRTPEEIAERHARMDRFLEEMKRLDAIEPLPDNFEAICEGRETVPVYPKAHSS